VLLQWANREFEASTNLKERGMVKTSARSTINEINEKNK
jgi:hypothetical protein